MIKKDKATVLLVTKSSWVDSNALGNTLSNFFANWEDTKFYNIYCKEELPQNDVCSGYFNITEKQIVKNSFRAGQVGREYVAADLSVMRKDDEYKINKEKEKETLDRFRKNKIAAILREFVWKIGNKNNRELDSFLDRINPDIIFAFAADPVYLQRLILHCKKQTKAKLVLFFADDTYNFKRYTPLEIVYKMAIRKSIKKSVNQAARLYGASLKLCNEYEKCFDKKIEVLYKGCSFDQYSAQDPVVFPIKVVYAGNLYYGRWKTLKALADAIVSINSVSVKINLEIYTTAVVTPELDIALNRGESSRIIGEKPYEEIKQILANANIVLHVESFEPKEIKTTRLSFSTKIIDCMQSGSCMMVIGPGCVASIEYLDRIEGAIVITDLTKIGEVLDDMLNTPDSIVEKAKRLNVYAREHHDIESVRQKLNNDFKLLIKD